MSMLVDAYRFGPSVANPWSAAVAALSPVAWLEFNETSGSTFFDSSGNGHDATKMGTPSLNQAPIFSNMGPCVLFNSGANDQYASLSDGGSFDFVTNDFLVMAAFKRNGAMAGSFGKIIFKLIDSFFGTGNYLMQYQASTNKVIGRVTHSTTTNVDVTSTTTFADATPYLVGLRRIGDEISLWVNGTKEATATLPSPTTALTTSANPVDCFGSTTPSSDAFTGYGDEVVIVNGTVLDATMLALWNARS